MLYPSAAQVLQPELTCQSFMPDSAANANWSEFCDPGIDAQIQRALAAEGNNSPYTAAFWAQADQTATNRRLRSRWPQTPMSIWFPPASATTSTASRRGCCSSNFGFASSPEPAL